MSKVVVTDKDTTLMNVVATVHPKTSAILCYLYIGRNVRAKCITNCRVKPKDVKVDGKERVVKEVKTDDIVKIVMRAWDDMVESPTKYSYASAVMRFKDVCKKNPKFVNYVRSAILETFEDKILRAWTYHVLNLSCKTTNGVEGLMSTYYNRVMVELTNPNIGISETFFPIRGRPPLNPKTHIMCLGLIPNHFVLVFF